MTSTFVKIRRPVRGTGRQCQHCGRPATTIATRVDRFADGRRFRMEVRYCDEHAEMRGVTSCG